MRDVVRILFRPRVLGADTTRCRQTAAGWGDTFRSNSEEISPSSTMTCSLHHHHLVLLLEYCARCSVVVVLVAYSNLDGALLSPHQENEHSEVSKVGVCVTLDDSQSIL